MRCSIASGRCAMSATAGAANATRRCNSRKSSAAACLPLLLVDERFFHLDKALCALGSGHVMAYMDAFSPHAQALLRRAIEPEFLIEIDLEDALAMAPNAVEVGDAVVMHAASRRLQERLNDAGYRVFCTELDEFIRAGGSAKCLTLQLDDGPVAALAAVSA